MVINGTADLKLRTITNTLNDKIDGLYFYAKTSNGTTNLFTINSSQTLNKVWIQEYEILGNDVTKKQEIPISGLTINNFNISIENINYNLSYNSKNVMGILLKQEDYYDNVILFNTDTLQVETVIQKTSKKGQAFYITDQINLIIDIANRGNDYWYESMPFGNVIMITTSAFLVTGQVIYGNYVQKEFNSYHYDQTNDNISQQKNLTYTPANYFDSVAWMSFKSIIFSRLYGSDIYFYYKTSSDVYLSNFTYDNNSEVLTFIANIKLDGENLAELDDDHDFKYVLAETGGTMILATCWAIYYIDKNQNIVTGWTANQDYKMSVSDNYSIERNYVPQIDENTFTMLISKN